MQQYDGPYRERGHMKYKHLVLPASSQAQANVHVLDFWLYSELDEVLLKAGNGQHR